MRSLLLNLSANENFDSKSIYDDKPHTDMSKDINPTMTASEIANVISDKLIHIVAENLQEGLKKVAIPNE